MALDHGDKIKPVEQEQAGAFNAAHYQASLIPAKGGLSDAIAKQFGNVEIVGEHSTGKPAQQVADVTSFTSPSGRNVINIGIGGETAIYSSNGDGTTIYKGFDGGVLINPSVKIKTKS